MADSTFVRIWEDLGIFSILIYLFILIQVLQVFLFETISYVQSELHRENQCSLPRSICTGPQTFTLK